MENLDQFIRQVIDQIRNYELCNHIQTFNFLDAARPKLKEINTRFFGPKGEVLIKSKIVIGKEHLLDLDFNSIMQLQDYTDYFYAICFKAFGQTWETFLDRGATAGGFGWIMEDHWKFLRAGLVMSGNLKIRELAARHACRVVTLMAAQALHAKSGSAAVYDWPSMADLLFSTDSFSDLNRQQVDGMSSQNVPRSDYFEEHGSKLEGLRQRPVF